MTILSSDFILVDYFSAHLLSISSRREMEETMMVKLD